MPGTNRNWQRSERYALKGRRVGGVHEMTAEEREAMFSDLGLVRTVEDHKREDERMAGILARKARRHMVTS